MAYSKEVRESVLHKVKNGESVFDISKDTGIPVATIYHWIENNHKLQKSLEKTKKASKKIQTLIEQENYEEARKACEECLLKDLVIQTQHVNVLIKIGTKESLEKATEICKKCLQNQEISMKHRKTFQRQYERAQSKKISILVKEKNYEGARKACEEYLLESLVIQTQHVNVLIKIGTKESLEKATEICKRCLQNQEISMEYRETFQRQYERAQSKKISILVKEENYEGARKACEEYLLESRGIQSQHVNILIKIGTQESLEKTMEICEKFLKDERISSKQKEIFENQLKNAKSKLADILIKEGKTEELKEIAEKYSDDPIIQSQYADLLIKKGTKESLEEAIQICEKFLKNERISSKQKEIFENQLKNAESKLADILIKENPAEVAKNDENKDKSALNRIKTKLYYDDVDFDFIEQVKQNAEGLSDWEKMVALVAIYDKQKNQKAAEKLLKESKKVLKAKIEQALLRGEQPSEEDTEKVKILNKLQSVALSKKNTIFDWSIYNEILGWNLDEKVHQEIVAKRDAEKAEQEAKREESEVAKKDFDRTKKISQKQYERIQSKKISILVKEENFEEARKVCQEFPENPVIQSQHVNILIKIGTKESLEEAIEICKKFLENEEISMERKEMFENQYANAQSNKIKILVKEEDFEGARKACEECLLESPVIQAQHVNILIKIRTKESLEKAIEICEKFLQNENISMKQKEIFQKQYESAQSNKIKILVKEEDFEGARKACEECLLESPVIQTQHVNVLIKIGTKESLEKATEICKRCLQNQEISMEYRKTFQRQYERAQSKKISILVKEENYEGARKACEEYLLESLVIQTQHVNVLIKIGTKESLEKATEICEKCLQNENISVESREIFQRQYERAQSKKISILVKEEDFEEARRASEEFPENPIIQTQHVNVLIEIGTKESLEKAIEICEKCLQNENISVEQKERFQRQYERAQKHLEVISENSFEIAKSDEKKEQSALDHIKTKLYYDDVDFGFIEQIKQNKELSDWERTVVLVAIYDKQKSPKSADKILRESKKALKERIEQALLQGQQPAKEDMEKVKILNKLQNVAASNKPRAFDWAMYDEILGWQVDEKVHQEIIEKREAEKAEQVAKQEKVESQIAQVEEKKPKLQRGEKPIEKPLASSNFEVLQKKVPKKPKVKVEKKPKAKSKSDSSVVTIGQEFKEELLKLRVSIMQRQNNMVFEDERLQVPNDGDFKRYHVPQEAINGLKAKFARQKKMDDDQDSVDKMTTKPISNMRAKMQLVCLLKKYGMGNVAEQKLPSETKEVNKLIKDFHGMNHETKLVEPNFDEGEEKE